MPEIISHGLGWRAASGAMRSSWRYARQTRLHQFSSWQTSEVYAFLSRGEVTDIETVAVNLEQAIGPFR